MNKEDNDMTKEYYKGWRYEVEIDHSSNRYSLIHTAINDETGEQVFIPHSRYERVSELAFQRHVDQGFIRKVVSQPTYAAHTRWSNCDFDINFGES